MSRLIVSLASVFFVALVSGCMSFVPGSERKTLDLALVPEVPANAPLCCTDLSKLPYRPLPPDSTLDLVLDQSSPLYRFEDGLSLLAAYELPDSYAVARLELRSIVVDEQVFQPTLMFLDDRFRPVRTLSDAAFPYVPARGFTDDSLYGEVLIHPSNASNERYLVIYSSESQQQGQTQLQHPAKAYAIAKGNVPPAIPDPVAEHSVGGYLQLRFDSGTAFGSGRWALWKDTRVDNRSMGNPVPGEWERAAEYVRKSEPLPETEAFYRQQIIQALDQGDLEKALVLGEEARRVGAESARHYLLQRLKVHQYQTGGECHAG